VTRRARRILIGLALLVIAATVVSLTIGRDLYEGRSPDLGSFVLVHFAGYLFFIVMPVEVLVPWYIAEGHAEPVLVVLAVVTAMVAQLIDYGIGRLVSGHIVETLIGERRLRRAQDTIDRYGRWTILLFNLTPLSSPTILAAAGVVRFGVARAMVWSAVGLVLKYVLIAWLFSGAA
jgi:membrane protein YqaA with SNARE-associated domain